MNPKILISVAMSIALSHPVFAAERSWSWLFVFPPKHTGKRAWSTDQGAAKDEADGNRFDIRIGGEASVSSPDRLDLYELRGTIHGGTVTARLSALDTDEGPSIYAGKLVTKGDGEHISLIGPDGSAILLYARKPPHR